MQIKKNDNVIVISGKDRGKIGKVLRAMPMQDRVVVEGVNIRKKRQRARKSNEKGQTIEMPFPIEVSNVMIFCAACNKRSRIRFKQDKNKKVRMCARCGKDI